MLEGSILQKRHVSKELQHGSRNNSQGCENSISDSSNLANAEEPDLSLMEELLLLVMHPNGYVSIWNDTVSRALRGALLIELWIRGKIELEPAGMRMKCLRRRVVILKDPSPTDDCILNEGLKLIKDSPAQTVSDWISYLSGETWNPLKLKYHMRDVRERLFKDLVERGILSTEKTNYWLMDVKCHPIKDFGIMKQLHAKVKNALLGFYTNDLRRADKRILSLLILIQYSGGVEQCLTDLSGDMERLALKRIQDLEGTDFEGESRKGHITDLHWAVYNSLYDPYVML